MSTTTTFRDELTLTLQTKSPEALAMDETFWGRVAAEYTLDERFVQLNYGYYHPAMKSVLDAEIEAVRELNRRGSHFKGFESEKLLEAARSELAALAGADADEVVITRNTSESMNIVIRGLALDRGDEVVHSDQDYGGMNEAWAQRAKDDGICLRKVAVPMDPRDDDEIIQAFELQLSQRTRLLHVTHLINLTGQVLPVAKLCALGERRGIPVLVDAAHSFAQIPFSIHDLGCDYLAASLHKWLGAPLGTGLLFVRKDRISSLRPLYGDVGHAADNIRRLEHFGNRPDSAHVGLREAIRWQNALGTANKQARLASLQRHWADRVRELPRFRVLTPSSAGRYGAIGLVTLDDVPAQSLYDYLLSKHRLFTAVQSLPTVSGVRITPGLPTSRAELDALVAALEMAARDLRM